MIIHINPCHGDKVCGVAVISYTLWTMLHVTVGHGVIFSGAVVISCTFKPMLQVTSGQGDMILVAAVIPHTLYMMLHVTAGHVTHGFRCCGGILYYVDHVCISLLAIETCFQGLQ